MGLWTPTAEGGCMALGGTAANAALRVGAGLQWPSEQEREMGTEENCQKPDFQGRKEEHRRLRKGVG